MQPFSITLFATTGDPEGIRHVEKSNWSGGGVVFSKNLVNLLKHEPGIAQAGIYILVGNAAEETIYIGEGDPVGDRLKTHVLNRDGWVWGVYFYDTKLKIGKTEVQFLESALVGLAKKYDRAILLNKNNPTLPNMAPAAKASAQAFLEDMLLVFPMLGINAFTSSTQEEPNDQVQPAGSDEDTFDTIVVPAHDEGFKLRFIKEQCWFAVRINAKHISKLKYIAAYQVKPVAGITHIAEIASIVPYNDTRKYLINFKGPATAIVPLLRPNNSEVNMQSSRYALRKKILAAKNLDEVWS